VVASWPRWNSRREKSMSLLGGRRDGTRRRRRLFQSGTLPSTLKPKYLLSALTASCDKQQLDWFPRRHVSISAPRQLFPAWLACMYAVFWDRSPIVEITFKRHANSSLTSLWRWLSENFVALFGIRISYRVLKMDPLAFLYLLKMYSNLYDFGGNLPGQSFNTTVFK